MGIEISIIYMEIVKEIYVNAVSVRDKSKWEEEKVISKNKNFVLIVYSLSIPVNSSSNGRLSRKLAPDHWECLIQTWMKTHLRNRRRNF